MCDVGGSRSGEYEDNCLPGCNAVYFGRKVPACRSLQMEAAGFLRRFKHICQTEWVPEDSSIVHTLRKIM
jgi:hypothetical protein